MCLQISFNVLKLTRLKNNMWKLFFVSNRWQGFFESIFLTNNLVANYEWVRDSFQNSTEGLSTAEEEIFIDFTASEDIKRQFNHTSSFEFLAGWMMSFLH